jgi:hypothetical protein
MVVVPHLLQSSGTRRCVTLRAVGFLFSTFPAARPGAASHRTWDTNVLQGKSRRSRPGGNPRRRSCSRSSSQPPPETFSAGSTHSSAHSDRASTAELRARPFSVRWVTTPSFRSPAPEPICAMCPTPSYTCSTPATSRWRRTSPKSHH